MDLKLRSPLLAGVGVGQEIVTAGNVSTSNIIQIVQALEDNTVFTLDDAFYDTVPDGQTFTLPFNGDKRIVKGKQLTVVSGSVMIYSGE